MSLVSALAVGVSSLLVGPVADPASPANSSPVPTIAPPPIPAPTTLQLTPTGLAPPRPAPPPVIVAARPARPRVAAGPRIPRGWVFDLSGGTSSPLAVSAAFQVEAPARVLGQLEIGGLLGRYVDALDAIAARARRDPAAAGLARDVSRNALVVRVALGARPLRRRGLELRGGYTVVTHGQSLVSLDAVGALADVALPGGQRPVPVRGTIHNVHFDIGWRWVIHHHFLVRAAIGYLHSLAVQMVVSDLSRDDPELIRRTNEALGRIAEDAAQTALRSPLLALHLGYRF